MNKNTSETVNNAAFNTPNDPNAKILIYAMQHLGYNNYTALCDIIDNSVDAGANEIKVFVTKDDSENTRIIIADNGHGMDEKVLDEALKFGSDTKHDDLNDLGKFGMGLCTASLSICDRTIVLTKTVEQDEVIKSITDVEVIKEANAFVKYLGNADEKDEIFFNSVLSNSRSGTIIILENCTGIKNRSISQFISTLTKEIARVFRRFMTKIAFSINDKPIEPGDPLMLSGKDTSLMSEVFSDDDYEVKWTDTHTGESKVGSVHVKLVMLPEVYADGKTAKELGINITNQGFSVLRNNREIAFGFMPWRAKHNQLNRVRGEISFDSSMDEAMGVDFTKNGIDMCDSIDNALRAAINPQISTIEMRTKKSSKASEEERSGHIDAENEINKRAHTLIVPPYNKEKRNYPENRKPKGEPVKKDETEKERQLRIPQKFQQEKANVRFDLYHMGRTGAIFEAEQQGKTIVIGWNVDHPFYDKFVVENKDNRSLVTSVDFLIYSLATAQIQAMGDDEDKAIMIDNIISTMSTNMRALLS